MKQTLLFVAVLAAGYLVAAFLEWQLNPGLWTAGTRFVTAVLSIYAACAAVFGRDLYA